MSRLPIVAFAGLVAAALPGCVRTRCCPPQEVVRARPVDAPEIKPMLPRSWALYDGTTGRETRLEAELPAWKGADLVAFGELHGQPLGAAAELAMLKALHGQGRPIALAMEFMERDVQPAVDDYLAGKTSAEAFMKAARQSPAYPATHGPLVEFCKEQKIPIIAANAPRRLVSAFRKQDESYETWKASLPEEDRACLPDETSIVEDAYRERFMAMMGARGESFFRSQSLWDDSMAEAMADFRAEHPNHRILFIVGGFHVQSGLGTLTKYKLRRGRDEIRILTMTMDEDPTLPFDEDDRGTGDLVLKVPAPQRPAPGAGPTPHRRAPTQPSPHEKPDGAGKPDA